MKEGEIPNVGSYVNILGTAFITIKGNCKVCAARGNLELCTKLPTCTDPVTKRSVVAFEKITRK